MTFGRAVSVEEKGSQLHRLVTENLAGSHSYLNTEGKQLEEREMGEDTGPNKAGETGQQPWSGQVWKREKPRLCLGFNLSSQNLRLCLGVSPFLPESPYWCCSHHTGRGGGGRHASFFHQPSVPVSMMVSWEEV